MLERYLEMYASEESAELSELQIKALDRLWAIGYDAGLYDCPVRAEDHLIPREYNEWRNL
jgi:1,4-dihydroxy-6-naphthoate synthase